MSSRTVQARAPATTPLPDDFWWVHASEKSTLLFASFPIVEVVGGEDSWSARVVVPSSDVVPQSVDNPSKDSALVWATTWVRQRMSLLARIVARLQTPNQPSQPTS
jgi:hypothetical protein